MIRRAAETARLNRERTAPTPLATVTPTIRRPAAMANPTSDAELDRRRREQQVDGLLKASRVPARYADADLADLSGVPSDVTGQYADVVRKLGGLLERPAIVAMLGSRGPGKTWVACGLVNRFCRAGRPAAYAEATDYFVAVKETFDANAKRNQSQVEADFLRPHLLVIDEMQERGDTPWEDRMLTRLVNKRYAAERATLLVSNQDKATFRDRVGPSIADRIRDDGGGYLVFAWDSLRGRVGNRTGGRTGG